MALAALLLQKSENALGKNAVLLAKFQAKIAFFSAIADSLVSCHCSGHNRQTKIYTGVLGGETETPFLSSPRSSHARSTPSKKAPSQIFVTGGHFSRDESWQKKAFLDKVKVSFCTHILWEVHTLV